MEDKKEIDKEKLYFWIRFVVWIITSLVIPVVFINYRYGLFYQINKVALSGWALLVGIIFLVFGVILIRYVLHARKYSYFKQIIKGVVCLILPLSFVIYCLYCSRETIEQLIQVLCVCTLSWTVAIAVNPMPKWTYEQSKGEQEEFINYVLDKRVENKNNKD